MLVAPVLGGGLVLALLVAPVLGGGLVLALLVAPVLGGGLVLAELARQREVGLVGLGHPHTQDRPLRVPAQAGGLY